MAHRQAATSVQPEHERKGARWLATPFLVMIVLVVLVIALAFAIARPWDTDDEAGRSAPQQPPAATAAP